MGTTRRRGRWRWKLWQSTSMPFSRRLTTRSLFQARTANRPTGTCSCPWRSTRRSSKIVGTRDRPLASEPNPRPVGTARLPGPLPEAETPARPEIGSGRAAATAAAAAGGDRCPKTTGRFPLIDRRGRPPRRSPLSLPLLASRRGAVAAEDALAAKARSREATPTSPVEPVLVRRDAPPLDASTGATAVAKQPTKGDESLPPSRRDEAAVAGRTAMTQTNAVRPAGAEGAGGTAETSTRRP